MNREHSEMPPPHPFAPTVKVVDLGSPDQGVPLVKGSSHALREGVFLTLAAEGCDCLLEVASREARVDVDGFPVMDVKHLTAGQVFHIDGNPFVVLSPLQAHVRVDRAVRPGMADALLTSFLASKAYGNEERATGDAGRTILGSAKILPLGGSTRAGPKRVKPFRLPLTAAALVFGLAGLGTVLWPRNAAPILPEKPAGTVMPSPMQPVPMTRGDGSRIEPEPTASLPSVALNRRVETNDHKGDVPSLAPDAADAAGPASATPADATRSEAAASAPAKRQVPRRNDAKPKESPVPERGIGSVTPVAVTKEQTQAWQAALDRAVLESNYDPDRAAARMQELLKEVPAGHAFAEKIKREWAAVKP